MLRLSNMSILPRRFLKLRNDFPPCVSCLFGQAHRSPWRHKSSTTSTGGVLRSADITKPGQLIGTDQIVSAQPGLVPQEKGQMTRARIWGATVFVDCASLWVKLHLMQDATGDLTMEAKNAFEQYCMTRNDVPKHYRMDNGQFVENSFKEDCVSKMQNLTFCGFGAHHHNGVFEQIINDLTFSSRTVVLHAQCHWLEYITTMFWSFSLVAAADKINNLHIDMHGQTP